MAVAAHTLIATDPATPLAWTSAHNDNFKPWTSDPRARCLLASCVSIPPKGEFHTERHGFNGQEWFAYVGYRAEALDAIRMEIGDRLLRAYHAEGESGYAAFNAWCREPNVTDAIDSALNASLDAARED